MDVKNTNKTKVEEKKDNRVIEFENKITELESHIEKLNEEKTSSINLLKKALADYANLERDMDKRLEVRSIQMRVNICKSLFKTIDDINFAMKASETLTLTDEVKNWLEGLKNVLAGVDKALVELGVTLMDVKKGDEYNSTMHEAVTTVPTGVENTIYDVIQPGFMLGDIVIRPAKVVISKGVKS